MENLQRKGLDEFSEESERFELEFDQLLEGGADESVLSAFITKLADWLRECARQGRFLPPASAERRAFRSMLERWNSRLRSQGYYLDGIDALDDFDPDAGTVLKGECPYPGLDPYTSRLRNNFFGRERQVRSFSEHLEQPGNRILLIIGASGSGKSSLALAGVIPALKEKHENTWWFAPRMTPGPHPVSELAARLAQMLGSEEKAQEIEESLSQDPDHAWTIISALCENKPLFLFVDQFEELLTMCRDSHEQELFSKILCSLSSDMASDEDFACRILLTLRTDHLARFENSNVLKPLYARLVSENNQRYFSAIGFEDIKRAIKGPADAVGLRFIPPKLIDRLASQTSGLSGGLPLLQFALRRLWDIRPCNEAGEPLDIVNESMVNSLPDVERALGTVANDIFATFSDRQKRICERLLLELIVLDDNFEEPLRRRRKEDELVQVLQLRFDAADDIQLVIDKFLAAGLLRRFGDESDSHLEVAHESLLRNWPHIYQLLSGADIKERLHLVKQIGREAEEWLSHGRAGDYLNLRGERLAKAVAYSEDGWLSESGMLDYVIACRKQDELEKNIERQAQEEKERAQQERLAREEAELTALRAKRNLWRMAVVAVLVITLGVIMAWIEVSNDSTARKLAMAAENELELDTQRSLLLAIAAADTLKGGLLPEVERALRSSIRASRVKALFKSYSRAYFSTVAYSPDGKSLILGDSIGGILVRDIASGRQSHARYVHLDTVTAIEFSPDGRKMASGSEDGKVVIWDTQTWNPIHVLSGHVDEVTSIAFSRPDGSLLATVSSDASLRLWEVATGKPKGKPLYGHQGGIRTVVFGQGGRQLMTAGEDRRVVIWDMRTGHIRYSLDFPELFDIALSADGDQLAIATGSEVEVWNTITRSHRWTLAGHTNSILFVRFSRDGGKVATASYDGTVRVWRVPEDVGNVNQHIDEIAVIRGEPHKNPIFGMYTGLAFSPDGTSVATTTFGGAGTIWNITTGGELLTLSGPESVTGKVAFSPDGKSVVTVEKKTGQLWAWNLSGKRQAVPVSAVPPFSKAMAYSPIGDMAISSGKDILVIQEGNDEPMRLSAHGEIVNDVTFSPDGKRLVSTSHDDTAIVWELPSGNKLARLEAHEDNVIAVAYAPDGKLLATGGKDSIIILWDATSFKEIHRLEGHDLGILDLAFTPDGRYLVSGAKDKTVRVWSVADGQERAVFTGHTDVINAVAISGNRLATADVNSIRLWDLETLTPLAVFPTRSDGAQSIVFSPDGRYLAAGALDGAVRVYLMDGRELVELARKRVHRGWKQKECQWFLQQDDCPRSYYSLVDEANRHFDKFDFETGRKILYKAAKLGSDMTAHIDAEIEDRLGSVFLWAADSVVRNPNMWEENMDAGSWQALILKFLLAAKNSLPDTLYEPEQRASSMINYQLVSLARKAAHNGNLKKALEGMRVARKNGWPLSDSVEHAIVQLYLVKLVSSIAGMPGNLSADIYTRIAREIEQGLEVVPEFSAAHRALARLYRMAGKAGKVEEHLLAEANAAENSPWPLAMLADWFYTRYTQDGNLAQLRKARRYARLALQRNPDYALAWYTLGLVEYSLRNMKEAVRAFDQVSSSSIYYPDSLNFSASIYFEDFGDNDAAYQRMTRAVQQAPDNLSILANYAEFLLAMGRYDQARLAADKAVSHDDAKLPGNSDLRVAQRFILFVTGLVAGDYAGSLQLLEQLDSDLEALKNYIEGEKSRGLEPDTWRYKGIRRSLHKRLPSDSTEMRDAAFKVLDYIESVGTKSGLDDVRQWLEGKVKNNANLAHANADVH